MQIRPRKPQVLQASLSVLTSPWQGWQVSRKHCRPYLADDVSVGNAHNHPVFRSVVLVFVLNYQTFASIVISFSL